MTTTPPFKTYKVNLFAQSETGIAIYSKKILDIVYFILCVLFSGNIYKNMKTVFADQEETRPWTTLIKNPQGD